MQAYLDEIASRFETWIDTLEDGQLHTPDGFPYWPESSPLDRSLYMLRHLHHDLGEIVAELRRRDLPRSIWR